MIRNSKGFSLFVLASLVIFAIALCAVPSHAATPPDQPQLSPELNPLFSAMATVESNNDANKSGDGGDAIGVYQIHWSYWYDSGTPGRYTDCKKPAYARLVVYNYWKRYCRTALQNGDYKTLARIHNGGPNGAKITATERYWAKISVHLPDLPST